jgi:short-subunit dehydrogenase
MRDSFTDQGFIITGAASGIGLATARLLKERGVRLVLWDRDADALQLVAPELHAYSVVVDITQIEQVQQAMTQTIQHVGAIHGLIHSAGVLHTGLFEQLSVDQHRRILEVNLFGTVLVAYAALPYIKQTCGSLILLGSASAFHGTPEFASYGATKAAILNLAQALRIELANSGMHIGVVNPLFVESPMLDDRNRQARLCQRFGVFHTADEVAHAIIRGV